MPLVWDLQSLPPCSHSKGCHFQDHGPNCARSRAFQEQAEAIWGLPTRRN